VCTWQKVDSARRRRRAKQSRMAGKKRSTGRMSNAGILRVATNRRQKPFVVWVYLCESVWQTSHVSRRIYSHIDIDSKTPKERE